MKTKKPTPPKPLALKKASEKKKVTKKPSPAKTQKTEKAKRDGAKPGAPVAKLDGTERASGPVVKSALAKEALKKSGNTKKDGASKKPDDKVAKKMSGLDAAYLVLQREAKALNTTEIMALIKKDNLWETKGLTPAATLYSAIIREISTNRRGSKSRFKRSEVKGKFVAA